MAYSPVPNSNTSGSNLLTHLQDNFLIRTALDALRPVFVFQQLFQSDDVPARSGKTVTWFRRTNMPAASTGVAEGIVPTSLNMPPTKTVSATVSQYTDYINISDILLKTAPDAQMAANADSLGFRAGLTLDNVARGIIDAGTGAAGTILGSFLSIRDFEADRYVLEGRNVRATDSGWYESFTHPYTAFDVVNDPSAGSLRDLSKFTDPNKGGETFNKADRDVLCTFSGVRIRKTTNTTQTNSNASFAGSPTTWRTYTFGMNAIGGTSLSGMAPNQVYDPNKQNFRVFSKTFDTPDVANPTGQIGGLVSYNFTWAGAILEGPAGIGGLYRYIYKDAPSSIVA